jgi:hypothetical protein
MNNQGKQKNLRFFSTFFPTGKKGMGIGQVFIFIISAITFALIMIFGYQSISQFIQSGEDVAFVQFKTGLENDIKKIYTEFGSVRISEYNLPIEYEQICFIDLDAKSDPELCKEDPAACSIWEGADPEDGYNSVDENVFLRPVAPHKIKVYDLEIDNDEKDYLCLPIANGGFSLYLEGRGDHTLLAKPAQ